MGRSIHHSARIVGAAVALGATLWTLLVLLTGGFALAVAGVTVSSTDATRPAWVVIAAAVLYIVGAGTSRLTADLATVRRRVRVSHVAALLSLGVLVVGLAHNEWTLGGPDSYSYVSQADLWLAGTLKVPVPTAAVAPWPNAVATFTPFGYRGLPDEPAITPMVAPGLPVLMAGFKAVGGHAAAFLVVPLCGAGLVWVTFLIGRRLASPGPGLAASWLVATSPTFLMLSRSQMSDVPAAVAWALATWAIMGTSLSSAVGGGLFAALAVLIRPNLVPMAAVLALPPLMRRDWRRTLAFTAGVVPAALVIAGINTWLFGSPMVSGYGTLDSLFAWRNIPVNLVRYTGWLFDTQTPLAVIGVAVLLAAPRRVWATAEARAGVRLLGAMFLMVWALYVAYVPFEAWWFLRFLLPAWPAMMMGTAALVWWVFDGRGRWGQYIAIALVFGLGVVGIRESAARQVFPDGEGVARYASIATLVGTHTEPDSMVLASMHAGPIRYYGGRATLRFDVMDPEWLDGAIDWLVSRGRHPYLAIEDWEVPTFRARFVGRSRVGDLRLAPVLAYRGYRTSGTWYLYDLRRADGPTLEPVPQRTIRPRATPPAAAPSL